MIPKISIIIPSYNSANYIKIALDSIKYQNIKAYEVIIIDAGSKDKTKEICETYDDNFKFKIVF